MTNIKDNAAVAWGVAALLGLIALLLAVSLAREEHAPKPLSDVLEEGRVSIEEQRDQIRRDCRGTDPIRKERCQEALDDMAAILQEFSQEIRNATTSAAP